MKRDISTNSLKSQEWHFDYLFCSQEEALQRFSVTLRGLKEHEVKKRLVEYGHNEPSKKKQKTIFRQIVEKFLNPLVLVLLIIGIVSLFLEQIVSSCLVALMAIMSVFLSFIQEYKAGQEAKKLHELVHTTASVLRDGIQKEVKLSELVPGDLVDLSAGDMVPADVRLLSSKDFFINQSSLTGESFPIEKHASMKATSSLRKIDQPNMAFMGSSVVSGTALALVVQTGDSTSFGSIYKKISSLNVETNFDKGIRQLTMLMVRAMIFLVAFIFCVISFRNQDFIEAFLFSLGVAVGLTPEMLPMIVTVTLSKGALALSKKKVIVKRLNSIQNFGAMDVLCTDKTGTLTLDKIVLEKHCDVQGKESEEVLRYAYINSAYQTGLKNVLDKAILKHEKLGLQECEKIDEIPFDFSRKIMSVVVKMGTTHTLISKGSPEEIFRRISSYELNGQILPLQSSLLQEVEEEYRLLSKEGFRVLAIAYKEVTSEKRVFTKEDEQSLILKGYVAFLDPPKPSVKETIHALKKGGVHLKVLTGDNELVTQKICKEVGLPFTSIVLGETVENASDLLLQEIVEKNDIFARLLPLQKERVVRALHNNGHIVGFLGDGINDAPSLKTSDVGISVNNAVDIAKESADIILLKKSLMVLEDGVREGRVTFGNIVKYIKMGSSSNFGNMFSMTGASMLLPFLPMLPIQILLNNFLYDLSQIAIPTDSVDEDYIKKPRSWNIGEIKKFMLIFGPLSSLFDYITFGVLLFFFRASPSFFHTGWFLESLCTQTLIIHVIRTNKIPFIESRPSHFLLMTSLFIVLTGLLIPFTRLGPFVGFLPMPATYFVALSFITLAYLVTVQVLKRFFIKAFQLD